MFKNLSSPVQLTERHLDPQNSNEAINGQQEGHSVSAGCCGDEQTDKESHVPGLPKESPKTSEQLIPGNMKFLYPVCCCIIAWSSSYQCFVQRRYLL